MHRLVREQIIARPRSEVFAFFEDPTNLARITPPFLHFRILTEAPIVMKVGTRIDYRIRLFGMPLHWRTTIELYERGRRFVDRQLSGPYAFWRHTHAFFDVREGTKMIDEVEYAIGLGPLGALAHALFVRATLERIFDYRRHVIDELFGPPALPVPAPG